MSIALLVGDSTMYGSVVSGGYGLYVANHFKVFGKGEVFVPVENCQDTRFTLSAFEELFEDYLPRLGEVDVIHWNNGLWDIIHFLGNERQCVPLASYVEQLEEIHAMMKRLCPRAKIIFATTTPVIEERCVGSTYRTNADVEAYNAAAVGLLSEKGVVINDLYSFAKERLADQRAEDSVHFTERGCIMLAERVIEVIDAAVQKDKNG